MDHIIFHISLVTVINSSTPDLRSVMNASMSQLTCQSKKYLYQIVLPYEAYRSPWEQHRYEFPPRHVSVVYFGACAQILILSRELNNTWLFDEDGEYTDDKTTQACVTFRGGSFIRQDSSTFKLVMDVDTTGGDASDNATVEKGDWGKDRFTLSPEVGLENFPLGIARSNLGEITQSP
jgi:hypothetical protein